MPSRKKAKVKARSGQSTEQAKEKESQIVEPMSLEAQMQQLLINFATFLFPSDEKICQQFIITFISADYNSHADNIVIVNACGVWRCHRRHK
mmetsp:Transcript_23357/g.46513  ORF Transcript_23357/g.46513 Transcript_23357/m.46513 type:complete len:92 (+) Transcript_23357:95-370(+)